ncbi:MAG: GtrA family protein [Clostridium sp.]|nr:GtrA family protein [Clostridium sp.]HHY08366.1 GtrA family protein [Mycobacteriales bacterium]
MLILALKYALFAGISTLGNLSTQHLILMLLPAFEIGEDFVFDIFGVLSIKLGLLIAIFFGTLTGLVIKYALDKRFIFNYETKNKSENTGKFLLYSFMGIFTTLIYWAFELSFDFLFDYESAKYIGAFIGLSIGYVIKYQLDKRFVFNHK